MIWLEAVLAFTLTMVVFSTMVTVIVQAILRISFMREKPLPTTPVEGFKTAKRAQGADVDGSSLHSRW